MKTVQELVDNEICVWTFTKITKTSGILDDGEVYQPHTYAHRAYNKDDKQCKELVCHKFRVLDDDGNIYAYGYSSDKDSEGAFVPLDLAMGWWGCTEIQYKEESGWETL